MTGVNRMFPRYLYPKEDELPIPHYFTDLELGLVKEKKKKRKSIKKKQKKRRTVKKKSRD